MALPQDADGSAERALHAGMATLAAAEALLGAARGQLDAQTAAALARLVMDLSSALLLLRALAAGDVPGDLFRRESARLALDPQALPSGATQAGPLQPGGPLDRLPAAARLGVLELVTLAGSLAGTLARLRAELEAQTGDGTAIAPRQNEKPRRRQGRPRLRVVQGTGPAAV
ncbi:hypothetical protein V5F49_13755 [Xanthobacter sp. V3C-3]|uniref:hypothetical protein n=1 Tax=Xanthobacter lutulentifluminis TaxID=3119935 RepID=UPI003729184B